MPQIYQAKDLKDLKDLKAQGKEIIWECMYRFYNTPGLKGI
jgi:hypothetical protein